MLSCVPAGTVTFEGGGGGAGALGAVLALLTLPPLFEGTVVRSPLSPLLLAKLRGLFRGRVVVAGTVGCGCAAGAVSGAGCCTGGTLAAVVEATSRLLTTVFTPSTWAASLAAAVRAASLLTLPERVTTPLLALMVNPLSGKLVSAKILFCTSDAICESERLPMRLQPTAASARASR